MRSIRVLAMVALVFVTAIAVLGDDEKKLDQNSEPFLVVRLVDEDGNPVADAEAGFVYFWNHRKATNWRFLCGVKSNADGVARFVDGREKAKGWGIYVRHAGRQLVAFHDTAVVAPEKQITVTMRPECHVSYRASCHQLETLGRQPGYLGSAVGNTERSFVQEHFGTIDSTFHVYLPPGVFELRIGGELTHEVQMTIDIKAEQRELDLGTIDLPATQLALLIGHPAPELHDVVEWKNGPALKLADLRGKVVLLEFWGYWCGGCVEDAIPEMFKLEEEFRGRDLAIIGIHVDADDNEVSTVEKLDVKLKGIRESEWNGKDIDFPVALVSGKRTSYGAGIEGKARTELSAEYGVVGYPTTVLIDQEGKVMGAYHATIKEDNDKLRKLLSHLLDAQSKTAK